MDYVLIIFFFACDMAKEMWSSLGRWCSLVLPECSSIHEWFSWIDAAYMPKRPKIILEGVTSIMLWSIWNFRNSWVFSDRKLKKANVWDLFVHQSFSRKKLLDITSIYLTILFKTIKFEDDNALTFLIFITTKLNCLSNA
ncbi:hypothetical protein Tco_0719051 [Tanacetum coccineum]